MIIVITNVIETTKHFNNNNNNNNEVFIHKRHRYDDIIMGFYGKAFNNGLQAKAAGSKPILFPANQNLGRSGLIILRGAFPCARPLSIAHHHVVHIAGLNQFSAFGGQIFSNQIRLCVYLLSKQVHRHAELLVTQCKVFSFLLTEKMA